MDDLKSLTEGLLNPQQAAHRLGMPLSKLARLRKTGGGPEFYRINDRCFMYDLKDLDAWFEGLKSSRAPSTGMGSERLAKNVSCPDGHVLLSPRQALLVSNSLPLEERHRNIKSSWQDRPHLDHGVMHWYVRREAILRCPGLTPSMMEKAGITVDEILLAKGPAA